jgi:hypothetical protein
VCNSANCQPLLKSPAFGDFTWAWASKRQIIPASDEVGFNDWAPASFQRELLITRQQTTLHLKNDGFFFFSFLKYGFMAVTLVWKSILFE